MQTINLNQNSFRLFPTIYMVQNDTGRELKMILDDVTLAGTETGAVAIKRSDGSYYTIPATLVTGENAFTADMTQALTQPSMTECQLKITDENDLVVSSYTFHIKVQPSTDGISEEQLGYSVQEVVQAANDIMSGGMPLDLRMALLQIASKVAYIDDHGQQYYQDLYDALMPSVELVSISAVYTQSGTVYDTDTLDSLKSDLVVTASYSDGTTETVPSSAYTLSGTLEEGTSTITVTYEGKTDTFSVTVIGWLPSSYTQYDYFTRYVTGAWNAPANAWIELKAYPDLNDLSCEFQYKATSQHTAGSCLFGRRIASGSTQSYAFYAGAGTLGYHLHGVDSVNAPTSADDIVHTVYYTNTAASPSSLKVDNGAPVSITWANDDTIDAGITILLNAYPGATSIGTAYYLQIGRIKLFDLNGNLVGDYLPALRNSDNRIGFFDLVEQTFYTSTDSAVSTMGGSGQKWTLGNWS